MGISSLGYLGFNVKNMGEWEKFCTDGVLGMEAIADSTSDTLYMRMDEYHHRFVLHSGNEDDLAFIGWEVATPEDLEEMRARLHKVGIEPIDATPEELADRKVVSMFKFRDVNDLPVEIFHGPLVLWEQPFKPTKRGNRD
jgi:2,3-dihydroxyethylbenzene 1,2-dioxygenase